MMIVIPLEINRVSVTYRGICEQKLLITLAVRFFTKTYFCLINSIEEFELCLRK